ncbi:MAG: DNA translocase FtsK 4TM domain-containing protein [Thiohalorhabdus sp.]
MRLSLLRETLAIGLLVAVGFALLALFTFHPGDPGWSLAASHRTHNAGGPVGAYLADVLLSFLGFAGYVLVVGVGIQGLRHLHGSWGPQRGLARWGGLLAVLVGLSGLLRILPAEVPVWLGHTGAGGILGALLGRFMVPYLHQAGSGLVLGGVLVVGLAAATGRPWLELMESIGRQAVLAVRAVGAAIAGLGGFLQKLTRRLRWNLPRLRPSRFLKFSFPRGSVDPVPDVGPPLEAASFPDADPPPWAEEPPPAPVPKPAQPPEPVIPPKEEPEPGDSPFPPLGLLDTPADNGTEQQEDGLEEQARLLEQRLADFNITAKVVTYHSGPVVTRFELELAPGTKVSKVTNLAKDLARSLAVRSVRVVENLPGKPVIGLEVPRTKRHMVGIREILESPAFKDSVSPLTLALGTDIAGQPVVADLGSMPHLLVAGTTGAGKSVGINAMLLSLLYKASSEEVRLILVDPKMLELSVYDGIPHLLAPVVTDMGEAANAFKWCIAEMERRFQLMAHVGVRSLAAYNQRVREAAAAGEPLRGPSPDGIHEGDGLAPQPWIVVVVDELADLMMVAGKQVEESITRLAQKARAAGIHLILATQRPSVDVLTGLIKANIPARIAFQVNQRVDSRTILDQGGAEQLLGKGDMLFFPASFGAPQRVHGCFVDDQEVERVVGHLRAAGAPEYDEKVLAEPDDAGALGSEAGEAGDAESDPLYDQAVRIVTESRRASISNVQRRLRVGYNRAARLIDAMEQAGVVGPQQSNGSREVLAPPPADG